jgi:hypothetical protein
MNPSEFNLTAQVACARRELGYRRYVFPKAVAARKMTPAEAEKEEACMEAILVTLTKLKMAEDILNEPPSLFGRIAPNQTP